MHVHTHAHIHTHTQTKVHAGVHMQTAKEAEQKKIRKIQGKCCINQ